MLSLVAALAAAGLAYVLLSPRFANGWHVQVVPPSLWVLATLGMAVSYTMRALRLRAEWRGRRDLGALRCLQVVLLHAAAVNVVPMRGGELGFPWLLNRYWRIALPDAASSLLWLRLQDAVVLAWLALLSSLAVLAHRGALARSLAAAAGVLITMLLMVFAVRCSHWSTAWLARRSRPASSSHSRARRWAGILAAVAIEGSARASVVTWAWSIANWIVKIAALGALLSAFVQIDMAAGWCGALAGELAAALPVQPPAGFGSYEAASAFGASLAGAGSVGRLLAGALAVHLFVLSTSLIGALLAWVSLPSAPATSQDGGAA